MQFLFLIVRYEFNNNYKINLQPHLLFMKFMNSQPDCYSFTLEYLLTSKDKYAKFLACKKMIVMPAIMKEVNRSMCQVAFSLSYCSSNLD